MSALLSWAATHRVLASVAVMGFVALLIWLAGMKPPAERSGWRYYVREIAIGLLWGLFFNWAGFALFFGGGKAVAFMGSLGVKGWVVYPLTIVALFGLLAIWILCCFVGFIVWDAMSCRSKREGGGR